MRHLVPIRVHLLYLAIFPTIVVVVPTKVVVSQELVRIHSNPWTSTTHRLRIVYEWSVRVGIQEEVAFPIKPVVWQRG